MPNSFQNSQNSQNHPITIGNEPATDLNSLMKDLVGHAIATPFFTSEISYALSALGLGAGVYLSSIGVVTVGGGLISGSLAGFMAGWNQNKENFDAILCAKKALVAFLGNYLSGGIFSYVDNRLVGSMLAGAISRVSALILEAVIIKDEVPTISQVGEKALYGALVGGMGCVAATEVAEYSEEVIAPLIEEGRGLIAKVVSQSFTGATSSATSALVNTLCDNVIEERPLTDGVVFNVLTAAGIGGSIASLKTVYAILDLLAKLALLEVKSFEASLAIKAEFNSKSGETIVIDAQNKVGEGNRKAMADALTYQMARMRWGEEGAKNPETQAARDLMHMTFMIDQASKNVNAHYGRLCRSVKRFMEETRGAWVSAELLDRYNNNESQTPEVKALLNSAHRESIWSQVFIEILDKSFAENGYKPLSLEQKQALSQELHHIVHDSATKKQTEEFVKTARAITAGNYQPTEKEIKNAIQIFYDANGKSKAIAQGEFNNTSADEIQEFPRNHSKLTKIIKSAWKAVKNMGAGAGANTNGQSITLTGGTAKHPDLVNIYTYKPKLQTPACRDAEKPQSSTPDALPMVVDHESNNLASPVAKADYGMIASVLTSTSGVKPQASSTAKADSIKSGKRRISTKKTVVIKGRDGIKRYHDAATLKFVQSPVKRMRTSQTSNTVSGSVSFQQSDLSVSAETTQQLIAPRPISTNSDITLGLSHSAVASASFKQDGLKSPKITAGASSELQILKGENIKVSASTASLGIDISRDNISVGARYSLFSASKQFELPPKRDESGWTHTKVTVTGSIGSLGANGKYNKQNLKNGTTKTQIAAGAGGGIFGVHAHVEITHSEAESKIEPPVIPVKM